MKLLHHGFEGLIPYWKADKGYYICIFVAFFLGVILAGVSVVTMPEATSKELLLYLNDFFQNIRENGADSTVLFKAGLMQNVRSFVFLFLSSVMVIGGPFIVAFAVLRGFMHGFTLIFMFRLYGIRTTLFFLLGMLPHELILFPAYLFLCVLCLKFSLSLSRGKQHLKAGLAQIAGKFLGLFALTFMAALLQAYVEPMLIQLIAGLYL